MDAFLISLGLVFAGLIVSSGLSEISVSIDDLVEKLTEDDD